MAKNVSLIATVSGRVQGVFFRDFVKREARNLGVVGEVMNKADGTVLVYAEGAQEKLEAFLASIQAGPAQAEVEDVLSTWGEATGDRTDFIIRYS